LGIATCHEIRHWPIVEEFVSQYPGHSSVPIEYQGFPVWLRIQHFINLFLMMFIIRSGICQRLLDDRQRPGWIQ